MKHLFIIALFITASCLNALPFNSKLSSEELEKLQNGEVIARNIDKYKNISLESSEPAANRLKKIIKDLDPNYLAELMQIRPYKGNENLVEKLYSVLSDIDHYAGIQYWSVRHKRYYDLYSTARIIEEEHKGNTSKYRTDLVMEPFGDIYTPITIEKGEDYLIYINTNDNDLTIKGVTAVKRRNMNSVIILFRDGDNWILYGAGGCKAPKIAMFKDRIETSFINRIKTFCNYVFTKI